MALVLCAPAVTARAARFWAAALGIGSSAWAATVGYWRFEEGSGSSAADASGNLNTGSLDGRAAFVSTVPLSSVDGQSNVLSLTLDGSGDFVSIADDSMLDLAGAFTIEALVRRA